MREIITSPLFRIAVGAVAAVYLGPPILNRVLIAEITPADEARNARVTVVTTATITTLVFVGLGLASGKPVGAGTVPA